MKTAAALAMAALIGANLSGADEPRVKAPVTRAALFKNGFALVVREIKSTPGKAFLIDEEIKPVHGTLWFSPAQNLSATKVKRQGEESNKTPFADLAATYENRKVTVTLKSTGNEQPRIIKGTMLKLGEQTPSVQPLYHYGYYQPPVTTSYLAIRQESGQLLTFDKSMIVSIESDNINEKIAIDKWMLLIDGHQKESPLHMTYLANGLSWAPSYRIALGRDLKLQLDQSAVITNEIEDLNDVEVSLISGFPNLEYMHVFSPLAPGMNLSQFFSLLSGNNNGRYRDGATSQMIMSNFAMAAAAPSAVSVSPLPSTGMSEDIHYTPAGRITLAKGESVYKNTVSAQADYERIVEWEIPDRRDVWGRYQGINSNSKENPYGDLWDAIRFKNPLKSPLTTAPVEIVDGDKILGQSTIKWVNPGEEALIKITKALTVSGRINEFEVQEDKSGSSSKISGRPVVYIAGYNYRNPTVEGTLKLHNYRSIPAKVVAKLQFSGEFVSAEKEPMARLMETGIYSVNPRRELTWELTLQPGEELSVKYSYTVLVQH